MRRQQASATTKAFLATIVTATLVVVVLVSMLIMSTITQIEDRHRLDQQIMENNRKGSQPSDWPYSFIHIVNTRFMQHQGNLTALGAARLLLFENICLRTMTRQTLLEEDPDHPSFLWIIKIDPELEPSLLEQLLSLTEPYKFIYVVASNRNFGIGIKPGGWRGGEAGEDVLTSKVYTGDLVWLRIAHDSRNHRAVLETRLDADDGLHRSYLQAIQEDATKKLDIGHNETHNQKRKNWMYWCPLNRIEWNPVPPGVENSSEYGLVLPIKAPHSCTTAGITLGASVGVMEETIPRFMHQNIFYELRIDGTQGGSKDCGGDPKEHCLHMLTKPTISVIRSRTPTSAGMKAVATDEEDFKFGVEHDAARQSDLVWSALSKYFGVNASTAVMLNRYMRDNLYEIARDNLLGQCTHDHSCKDSTKAELQRLMEDAKKLSST